MLRLILNDETKGKVFIMVIRIVWKANSGEVYGSSELISEDGEYENVQDAICKLFDGDYRSFGEDGDSITIYHDN